MISRNIFSAPSSLMKCFEFPLKENPFGKVTFGIFSHFYIRVSTAVVGHHSSDGVTAKIPYGLDVSLHRSAMYLILSYWVD